MGNKHTQHATATDDHTILTRFLLSNWISTAPCIFELDEMWSNYARDPVSYQQSLRDLLNDDRLQTPTEVSLGVLGLVNKDIILNETNDMSECAQMNDYPVDLIVGVRFMTDNVIRFRVYCTKIFLGEYEAKEGEQIIRFKKPIPYIYIMKDTIHLEFITTPSPFRLVYATLNHTIRKEFLMSVISPS